MTDPSQPSIIERALQLADAGTCRTMDDLKKALRREGHLSVEPHLAGKSVSDQLRARMKAAQR